MSVSNHERGPGQPADGVPASDDDLRLARSRALRYLEARDRSRFEVASRLRRYGYDSDVTDEVVAWLSQLDYIDDRRFADEYTRRRLGAGMGLRRIRRELSAKGVARDLVESALAACALPAEDDPGEPPFALAAVPLSAPDPFEVLVELVRRRFERAIRDDPAMARRRIGAFVARRGHDTEVGARVWRRVSEEHAESDD